MDYYQDRINKIKEIIRKRTLTQKQFAEIVGYTQQSISRYLVGKSRITENFLIRVHEAFPEYSMRELMCFKDETDLSGGICRNRKCKWYRSNFKNGCYMLNNVSDCTDKTIL